MNLIRRYGLLTGYQHYQQVQRVIVIRLLVIHTGKVVCKIKGFKLNYETTKKINSDSINNILENKDNKISTQHH
jgi:hypothetical protein